MSKVDGKQQERAEFEAWTESIGLKVDGWRAESLAVLCAESAFKAGYQAAQAKIESKDAEIARLREALEEIRSQSSIDLAMNSNPFALTAMMGYIYQTADDALAQ